MSKYAPRGGRAPFAPAPQHPRSRKSLDDRAGVGMAVPSWLRPLREAGYDLRRIPEHQRRAVADALRFRGIDLHVFNARFS